MSDLEVTIERTEDATFVRPAGDIDLSRAPALRQWIGEAMSEKPAKLIVDLASVPYMDSSGVATLVEAMQVARRQSAKLVLCGLQDKVRSIFEIARLDMVFTITDDAEAALLA